MVWTEARRIRHLAAVDTTAAGAETMRIRRVGRLVMRRGGGRGSRCRRRREARSGQVVVDCWPLSGRVLRRGGGGGRRTGAGAALDRSPEAGRAVERQRVVDDVVAVVLAVGVDRADDGDADTAAAAGARRRGGRRASAAPDQLRPRARHADVDAARARPGRRVLRRVAVHSQVASATSRRRQLGRRSAGDAAAAAAAGRSMSRLDDAAVRRLARRPAHTVQVRAGAVRQTGVVRRLPLLRHDVGLRLSVVDVEDGVS